MNYEGTLYRPPSEARSLIFQVTIGCSHNKCSFCTMYKDKQFRVRSMDEISADIDEMARYYGKEPLKIFLADGDALVLKTEQLLRILKKLKASFPHLQKITSYATAGDILRKTDDELKLLRENGLSMVYVGAESGDDEILKRINKGITIEEMKAAAEKLKKAGIALSLTLISGIGGQERKEAHAIESARLVSEMEPEYLGFLTLMLDEAAPIMKEIKAGSFRLLTAEDVAEEMRVFLQNVDSEGTVFRANHASNFLILKGNLNSDIPVMLEQIRRVEESKGFRDEWTRRL